MALPGRDAVDPVREDPVAEAILLAAGLHANRLETTLTITAFVTGSRDLGATLPGFCRAIGHVGEIVAKNPFRGPEISIPSWDLRARVPPCRYNPGMDGPSGACCGACAFAAETASAGGPAASTGAHLHVERDAGGVPRGVTLVLRTEGEEPRRVPVGKDYLVLGRTPPADVVVEMIELSRRQCGFDFRSGEVVVEDLGSACGTYVNGAHVQRAALRAGDQVRVANLIIDVEVST